MKTRFIILLQAALLVLLVSCQQISNTPFVSSDPEFLGTATFTFGSSDIESAIESQALVNGISFEVLGRSVIDVDGERYTTLSLKVVNGSNQNLNNLSLFALARDYTVAGTALTNVRDAAGNPITNPEVVRAVRPSHTVTLRNGQAEIVASEADFQGYLPTEVSQVQADADEVADDITVLNYGYAVRNTNGNRAIPAGESGIVSFTVRFPFDPDSPLGSPFRFSMPVAFVDMPQTRFTRGWDESNQNFTARIQSYYAPNAVPQDTELLLIGEPSAPLTIGTTLTVADLRLFVEATEPDLATFEDELGMVVRVDRDNRVLAATFVDEDNRGRRLRVVPQANTQYFVEDEAVSEEVFWQQLKDVPEFVLNSDTVIVTGQQVNEIVVVADKLVFTDVYDYSPFNPRGTISMVTDVIVNSSTDIDIELELGFFGPTINTDDFSLSRITQTREGEHFDIDIDLRSTFVPTGIDLPTGPPTSFYKTLVFLFPLDLSVPLDSGSYTIDIGGALPAMFVVP